MVQEIRFNTNTPAANYLVLLDRLDLQDLLAR
jgi:hypothetical protein